MRSNRKAWIFIAVMAAFFATLSCGILIGRMIGEKSVIDAKSEETVKETTFTDDLPDPVISTAETKKEEAAGFQTDIMEHNYLSDVAGILGSDADKAYVRSFFTEYSKEPKLAELVDQNFYSLFDIQAEDADFAADLVAVCGESDNLRILVDVTVKDKDVAKQFETLSVEYYNISPEKYETEREHYATTIIYGTKDSEQENLFHCVLQGYYAWLVNEEESLVAFKELKLLPSASSGREAKVYASDIKFTFVTPASAFFHGVSAYYFGTQAFEYNGVTYQLQTGLYYLESTHLAINYTFADTKFAKENDSFNDATRELGDNFRNAIDEMYLIVDGTKMDITRKNISSFYFDEEEGKGMDSRGIIWLDLAPIDFKKTKQLELHVGSQTLDLKFCETVSY